MWLLLRLTGPEICPRGCIDPQNLAKRLDHQMPKPAAHVAACAAYMQCIAVHMCMLTGPVYCDSSGSSSVFSNETWLMSRYVPSLLHSKLQQSESTSWRCQACIVTLLYSCAKPAYGHKGFSQTNMLTSWLHCMHDHTKPAQLF